MTEYYLAIKMNESTDTHFNIHEHWKKIILGGTICTKDLMLYNSAISNTLNRKIYAETRLVVSRGKGKEEIGATASEHDVSLWSEENILNEIAVKLYSLKLNVIKGQFLCAI